MNRELLISLFLSHFIGDFVLQTNKISALKSKNLQGVAVHCSIILFLNFIMLIPFGIINSFIITISITCTHFIIDTIKLKLGKIKMPTVYFFIDQILHFISMIIISIVYKISGNYINYSSQHIYAVLIMIIICTYVSTIIIKQLYFSYGFLNFAEDSFFAPKERYGDMLFQLIYILILFNINNYIYIIALGLLILFIHYKIHKKIVKPYKIQLLKWKLLFYSVWINSMYYLFRISTKSLL